MPMIMMREMNRSTHKPDPTKALITLRLAWVMTIVGQVVFAGVVASLVKPRHRDALLANTLFYGAIIALVLLVPIAYFIRNQIYKANWVGHAITPRGYLTGNIALFVIVEMVSIAALVGGIIANDDLRPLIVFASAMGVLAINFPTGKPMRETMPGTMVNEDT